MSNLKTTKEKIIHVARDVFANLSVYKTTMGDIAKASKLGRRTIYTYFATKEELYSAVVETETNNLIKGVIQFTGNSLSTEENLQRFIRYHFFALKRIAQKNPSVREDLINNGQRIEEIREKLDREEMAVLKKILEQGKKNNSFYNVNCEQLSFLILQQIKALELTFIDKQFDRECTQLLRLMTEVYMFGISKNKRINDENVS